ncbi:hypothetical protein WME75_39960 [Sorangium sp. So ce1014]
MLAAPGWRLSSRSVATYSLGSGTPAGHIPAAERIGDRALVHVALAAPI